MGSLLHCLRRTCWESDDIDEEHENENHSPYNPPQPASIMGREPSLTAATRDEEDEDISEDCCRSSSETHILESGGGLLPFWHRLTNRTYQEVAPIDALASSNVDVSTLPPLPVDAQFQMGQSHFGNYQRSNPRTKRSSCSSPDSLSKSPLRAAISFETNVDHIQTIHAEEVVLPGSLLQRQMAMHASIHLEAQGDECVICMEAFDFSNPRIPTTCGCGENKTFFHLPCLFQWADQSGRNCPTCRQTLIWEEL